MAYREIHKPEVAQQKPNWECSIFGHEKQLFADNLVKIYTIDRLNDVELYFSISYICDTCKNILTIPVLEIEFSDFYQINNTFGKDEKYKETLKSYSEIQYFLQKCKFTRKKKWYESYDYEFFIQKTVKNFLFA